MTRDRNIIRVDREYFVKLYFIIVIGQYFRA